MTFTIVLLAHLTAAVVSAQNIHRKIDYVQCQSESDYGWPRFSSQTELEASPWGAYLREMYGALPQQYPFCTFDLWYINKYAKSFPALGITPDPSKASHGNKINHTFHRGDYDDGDFYDTDFGNWIYHSDVAVVPNNTWIEVQHALFKTETKAMWFTRSRGSNIWYNVGRSISFISDDGHNAAYDYFAARGCKYPVPPDPPKGPLNCSDPKQVEYCLELAAGRENAMAACAAAEGWESIQFASVPGPIINTFGHVGWIELLSTSLRGNYSCGTPRGGMSAGFRYGWDAADPCDCVEGGVQYAPTNCNGNKRTPV